MATLLQIIQTCAKRIGVPTPSTVIGNGEPITASLLAKLEEAGLKMRDQFSWPELQKEFTFTLATDDPDYQLPDDFNYQIFSTQWNRTQQWPLLGPINAEMWQQYKSGVPLLGIYQRYRVKGWATGQFFIDPTPDSSHNGDTCVLEYCSRTWIRPTTAWAASTAYTTGQYRYHNGNVYVCASNGTSGSTGPSHLVGTEDDGTTSWTIQSYESFVADTDVPVLNTDALINETVWRWKSENGFDYQNLMRESQSIIRESISDLQGAGPVYWGRARFRPPLIGPWNLPDGSW